METLVSTQETIDKNLKMIEEIEAQITQTLKGIEKRLKLGVISSRKADEEKLNMQSMLQKVKLAKHKLEF